MLIPFSKQQIQKKPTKFTAVFYPFIVLVDPLSSTTDSRHSILQSITNTVHFRELFHLSLYSPLYTVLVTH